MTDECIFCRIAEGTVPVHRIWEDAEHIAFLSHRPNTRGFTVVATKEHQPSYAFAVEKRVLAALTEASAEVGRLLDRALPDVGRTGLIYEGFGVDHLHAKLFPMHGTDEPEWTARHSQRDEFYEVYEGFVSSHDAAVADPEDLEELATQIRAFQEEDR